MSKVFAPYLKSNSIIHHNNQAFPIRSIQIFPTTVLVTVIGITQDIPLIFNANETVTVEFR